MPVTIVTNNHPRDVLHWWDLSEEQQKDFDYLDTDDRRSEASFFYHRKVTYDLGEFCRISRRANPSDQHPMTLKVDDGDPLLKWHGYLSDSFSSMVVVRYTHDSESVVVGTVYS